MSPTLLLADDDEVIRNFVSVILERKGYNLLLADCAKSALERASKVARLDLVIADLGLPDLNGIQLFEMVSCLHPEARPLFISGYPEEEARQLYTSDGFRWEFLGKPFLPRELLTCIERIMDQPRQFKPLCNFGPHFPKEAQL